MLGCSFESGEQVMCCESVEEILDVLSAAVVVALSRDWDAPVVDDE